jgi:polysaccharide export outer membrane protein
MNHQIKSLVLLVLPLFLLTCCTSSQTKIPEFPSEAGSDTSQGQGVTASNLSAITQISHTSTNELSRVTFVLSQEAKYTMSQTENKLILEISDAAINPSHQEIPIQGDLVKLLTVDQVGESLVRAVFAIEDENVDYNPTTSEQPFRITIDLKKSSTSTKARTYESIESKPAVLPETPPDDLKVQSSNPLPEPVKITAQEKAKAPSAKESPAQASGVRSSPTTSVPEKKSSFQQPSHTSQLASEEGNPSQDYRIGPGDVIKLSVLEEENFNKTYTVSPNGRITVPLLGEVSIEGLTLAEVDNKITELLKKDYLVDPQVTVEAVRIRTRQVNIIGAVRQPGTYELEGDSRIMNTLLKAGGPTSFDSELKILRLPRKGQGDVEQVMPFVVSLRKLFVEGDISQNVRLRDGDVLIVSDIEKGSRTPSASSSEGTASGKEATQKDVKQIYVLGSVAKPGAYEYQDGDTVLDVILRAGGFTEFASKNGTKVVREIEGKTETFKVKMEDVMKKGARDKNPPVYPGDMIIVPESLI